MLRKYLDIGSFKFAAAVIIMVAIISRCKETISTDEFGLLASSFVILEFIGEKKLKGRLGWILEVS